MHLIITCLDRIWNEELWCHLNTSTTSQTIAVLQVFWKHEGVHVSLPDEERDVYLIKINNSINNLAIHVLKISEI